MTPPLPSRTRFHGGRALVLTLLLLGPGLAPVLAAGEVPAQPDFNRDVRPILARHCLSCHGQDEGHRKAELRLDRREDAVAERADGTRPIAPGDPDGSEILFRISEDDPNVHMPPPSTGDRMTDDEVTVLKRWVEQGAEYAPHWAFARPVDRPLPTVADPTRARGGIDRFLQHRLDAEGLRPSPEADRSTLLRRLSLDLRGLPPTPVEIAAFAGDPAPDAYERAVDRLLADPGLGEKWARMWLDLARYADSAGFGSDPLRPNMWRYRDWVIDAFNRNLPYDRFLTEQLAGDLLPEPTLEQRVATAFHRNTMTNTEGGTDDEEFRIAAIKDRVDTTGQVVMGLTFGCAKCHTHKYDPITHEEYYRLFAVFNQTADFDQPDERPTLAAPSANQIEANRQIDAAVAVRKAKLDASTPELEAAQAAWERSIVMPPTWRPLAIRAVKTESGAAVTVADDGLLTATGDRPAQESYTIEATVDPRQLRAIRLETLPDATLPKGGAGRADDGNFVLSRVAAELAPGTTDGPTAPVGRFVRVELPGAGKMLSLAEVQVFGPEGQAIVGGVAKQSSTDYGGDAARARDGQTDGHYEQAKSTTHTRTEANPWWELELPAAQAIARVVVWNRTDNGTGARLAGARVLVLDADHQPLWSQDVAAAPAPSVELTATNRRTLPIVVAWADHEQPGFAVANTIQGVDPKKGWAVGPQIDRPHTAVFGLGAVPDLGDAATLAIRLEHRYKDPGFVLGRFRLATSGDASAVERSRVPAGILAIIDTPPGARTDAQRQALAAHYRSIAPELKPVRDEIARLEASRPKPPMLPVMAELPTDKRRPNRILNKGNFLDPGKPVEPGVLAAFHPLAGDAPANRLGLAQWLVDRDNPLTARVAVNRVWAQLFGTGLVESEEDFGTQGELPSHPELLDWLALRFQESGWDTKALLRQIVTSAAYRQSSRVEPDLLAKDPKNRLLARAPRGRLDAETIRDQALALSGLLSQRLGGPSVFPAQPDGLWQAAFNGERTWSTSPGTDRHRRGLYTFWRRTVPYPSMAAFDAPSRELCTPRRIRSNTPLQAFVVLNDPVYVEAAQALGRRIVREGGATVSDRVRFGLTLSLGRPATAEQVAVLVDLFEAERSRYASDPEAARALATEPIGPLPPGADPAEMAAWTAVANVLLNLDGVLTKG